ncbi:hypothetical protein CIK06_22035 [Plantactinospora sp. KBS50]|nr:hypothetical protein [Plantactinospora sp. KBS50]ASW56263.1 hypothetical protein CIK06_22035 [Plantactinospora sp. KBS50]
MAAAAVAFTVVGVGAFYAHRSDLPGPLPRPIGCVVQAEGTVNLDPAQMANAATIAAVGIRRGMPERGIVVALATAFQESRLRNLAGGDRDSVGLFQQRPSQGWGTPQQIRDPRYAAERFYSALHKVHGWERMRVTDAAQKVQRSAFPEAYQQWADDAAVLARALLGNASGAVACTVAPVPALRGVAATTALTSMIALDWGTVPAPPPDRLAGFALAAVDARAGWRYAHWLVSHADDNGVKRVRFAGLQWTAGDGTWSAIRDGSPSTDRVIAEVFADER